MSVSRNTSREVPRATPEILTIAEVAELMQISPKSVTRLEEENYMPKRFTAPHKWAKWYAPLFIEWVYAGCPKMNRERYLALLGQAEVRVPGDLPLLRPMLMRLESMAGTLCVSKRTIQRWKSVGKLKPVIDRGAIVLYSRIEAQAYARRAAREQVEAAYSGLGAAS